MTTVTQTVIRDLAAIERLAELPRLVRLCAACTATELNVSALASDFGVPNRSSKIVRRPKLVMADSGLAAHLIGADRSALDGPDGRLGPLFETFVVNEIRKQTTWSEHRPSMWHFRDRGGAEVDLVLEHPDGRIVALEVKATSTPRTSDLSGLRFLSDRLGERFHFGVLLSAAPEATPFGPRMAALPVSAIWS